MVRSEEGVASAGEGRASEEGCGARAVEQESGVQQRLCHQESQQRCAEQERETTMLLPKPESARAYGSCGGDAGTGNGGGGSPARDERIDGLGAVAGTPAGTAAVDMSCGDPTSPFEVTATAAVAGAAAGAAAAAGTAEPSLETPTAIDAAMAEASSVWDLDSLDFEEEEEEGDPRDEDGSREAGPAPHGCGQKGGEKQQEQEEVTTAAAVPHPAIPRPAERQLVEGGPTDDERAGGAAVGCGAPVVTAVAAVAAGAPPPPCDRARELMPPPPPNVSRAKMRRRRSRVTLMHSPR